MLVTHFVLALLCIGDTLGYSDRSMIANPGECCVEKMVDMEMYILAEIPTQELAQAKGCASACSYRRLEDDGTRWCFGASGPSTVNSCTSREQNYSSAVDIPLSSTTEMAGSAGEVALLLGGVQSANQVYQVDTYGSCNLTVNPYPHPLYEEAAAVLDGVVYCCGGVYHSFTTNTNLNCYLLEKNYIWSMGPKMRKSRSAFTLNAVGTKLVALGGYSGDYIDGSTEVLSEGKWEVSSFIPSIPRAYHCTVTLGNTDIAVLGGVSVMYYDEINHKTSASVFRIDIETGEMSRLADLPQPSMFYSCEVLENNIFVVDGDSLQSFSLDFSSSLNSWIALASINTPRLYSKSAILNGNFVLFGGLHGDRSSETYITYHDGIWTTSPMVERNHFLVAVLPCN